MIYLRTPEAFAGMLERATEHHWTSLFLIASASYLSPVQSWLETPHTIGTHGWAERTFRIVFPLSSLALHDLPPLKRLALLGMDLSQLDLTPLNDIPTLEYLDLRGCKFPSNSWVTLSASSDFVSLDLSETDLTVSGDLIYTLAQMNRLRHLDISHCYIEDESAKEFYNLNALNSLGLNHCRVIDSESVFFRSIPFDRLNRLQRLNLAGSHFGGEPIGSLSFPELNELDLTFSDFCKHIDLSELTDIVHLTLRSTRLEANSIQGFKQLTYLRSLDLSENALSDDDFVPLIELPRLRSLSLARNHVTDRVVSRLCQIQSLHVLDISENRITASGVEDLMSLANLTHLNLSGNDIGDAGLKHLVCLPNLKILRLNQIGMTDSGVETLYKKFVYEGVSQLTELELVPGNTIHTIETSILRSRDAQKIFDAHSSGVALHEVCIMFVGEGEVGKTWLRRRCFGDELVKEYEHPERTHDIDLIDSEDCRWKPAIQNWGSGGHSSATAISNDRHVVIPHVWDFAGQTVCHGVHESFMTFQGRTVFILVLSAVRRATANQDVRHEGNQIAYWLNSISYFAGDEAPVLIAVTQWERLAQTSARARENAVGLNNSWKRDLPKTVKCVVDQLSACDPAAPIEKLRTAINTIVEGLPIVREAKIPAYLPTIRHIIRANITEQQIISIEEYQDLCIEAGITDDEEQFTYLRILAQMGDVFFFGLTPREHAEWRRDYQQLLDKAPLGQRRYLRKEREVVFDRYVINPAWFTRIVYAIIRRSEIDPWFSRDDLNSILKRSEEWEQMPRRQSVTGEILSAFLRRVELSIFDPRSQKYLFPRGAPIYPSHLSAGWIIASLRWEYVPEAAFHRLCIAMRGFFSRYPGNENVQYYRNALSARLHSPGMCVLFFDIDNGVVEIRCSPQCVPEDRNELFDAVRHRMVFELLHVLPVKVFPFPPLPQEVKEIDFLIRATIGLMAAMIYEVREAEVEFVTAMFHRVYEEIPASQATSRSTFLAGFFFREFVPSIHQDRCKTGDETPNTFATIWNFLEEGRSSGGSATAQQSRKALGRWRCFARSSRAVTDSAGAFERNWNAARRKYQYMYDELRHYLPGYSEIPDEPETTGN